MFLKFTDNMPKSDIIILCVINYKGQSYPYGDRQTGRSST